MSEFFFSNFPVVDYVDLDGKVSRPTDITRRFRLRRQDLLEKFLLFSYVISEGETPEMIAEGYYGDSSLDWLVLLANNIVDPDFDWPLDFREFRDLMVSKYGSEEEAKNLIVRRVRILSPKTTNSEGEEIPERTLEIDSVAYGSLPVNERRRESAWEVAYRRNEERRNIFLVDKSHLPQILRQKRSMYGD